MKPDFQRRIQRYGWDRAANLYEPAWQDQLKPAQTRLLEMAGLKPGERVLDVACGTGLVTFPAARAVVPGGEVVGVDISEGMVEYARRTAREQGIDHVTFERREAEALGFEDHSFDVALCSLGLMYVPDPLEGLREMYRVLVPGGRAVAAVWGRRDSCGWAEIFPIVEKRVASDVCPLFFQLGTGDSLEYGMKTSGFTDITVDRFATIIRYDTAEAACSAAFEAGPVALAYHRFDDPTRKSAFAEYVASIEPYHNGRGFEIPGEFVVASGFKPA